VISRPQSLADRQQLARLSGRDLESFTERYWAVRSDYDRGDIDLRGFWGEIVAVELTDDLLDNLGALDIASWTNLDERSVAAVELAAKGGLRLALLSNAPFEVARLLDVHPWFAKFEHRLFSCDLRLTKPDPQIYRVLVDRLGCAPDEVTFVDDRMANVDSARAVGINALRFTGPEVLESLDR